MTDDKSGSWPIPQGPCSEHSGMCTKVANVENNCREYRLIINQAIKEGAKDLDKAIGKVDAKFQRQDALLVSTLITVVINMGIMIYNLLLNRMDAADKVAALIGRLLSGF